LGLLEEQEGQPQSECWFSDYRELATGCAYPMKQGYVQYLLDEDGEAHPGLRCDIAVTEAEVDGKLPDVLFSIPVKEGVQVRDGRYQPPLDYRHKADRTVQEWNTIVEEAKRLQREQVDRETARDALIGKPAPQLVATTWLNSKPLTWDDLAGKVVVLNFGAIGCPACLGELPHMQSWHDGRERIGSLVIWVHAYSDDIEAIRVFLRKHEYTFPVCVDAKPVASTMLQGPTFDRYGMWGMPHAFVVDQKGRIAAHGFGIDRHPVGPKAVELVRKPPE
jgi:peroxiredoxin